MSYQITEEEKNKVKLNSPFALPTSPTERGMKPDVIKAMFWKPFEILIGIINSHFDDIVNVLNPDDYATLENLTKMLEKKQNQLVLGVNLDEVPKEHSANMVTSGGVHSALLELRNIIQDIHVPNIHYETSFSTALASLIYAPGIKPNDIIIITQAGAPDLVVFHVGSQAADGALLITQAQIEAGAVPTPKAGDRFTIENAGLGVICLECGIVEPKITVEKELCDSENPIAAFVVDEIIQTIVERVDTAESIAKGANQAVSFYDYLAMISELNNATYDKYKVGQNIMIEVLDVPDLWISYVVEDFESYNYGNDEFLEDLKNNSHVKVGHYYLSALETQKVDLTEYATKDEVGNIVIKQAQFTNGDTITVANNTIYTATEPINTLAIEYPSGDFICSIQLTLADDGDITISLPTSEYIGETPTFSNGETWELNIRNGVVVGGVIE